MIQEKLLAIQLALKAPKNLRNTFGNYNYRSAEDILEAVKPLLNELGCSLTITDELVNIGERYYIKATPTLSLLKDPKDSVSVTGYAREEENKKGMDGSQITGASSSYARKYALNGLFLIDDNKDSDFTNKHGKEPEKTPPKKRDKQSVCATEQTISKNDIEALLLDCSTIEEVTEIWWKMTKEQQEDKNIKHWFSSRKGQL